MANNKPFMSIKTKEEFDKLFESIYSSGKEEGFRNGLITALAYILELKERIENEGNHEDILRNAEYMLSQKKKMDWERSFAIMQAAKKQAVDDYIKSQIEHE